MSLSALPLSSVDPLTQTTWTQTEEAETDAEGRAALPIEGGQDARYHFHMVAEHGSDPRLAESQTSSIMTMLQRLESKVDALMMRGDRQLLAPKRTAEPAEPTEPDSVEEAADTKTWIFLANW